MHHTFAHESSSLSGKFKKSKPARFYLEKVDREKKV